MRGFYTHHACNLVHSLSSSPPILSRGGMRLAVLQQSQFASAKGSQTSSQSIPLLATDCRVRWRRRMDPGPWCTEEDGSGSGKKREVKTKRMEEGRMVFAPPSLATTQFTVPGPINLPLGLFPTSPAQMDPQTIRHSPRSNTPTQIANNDCKIFRQWPQPKEWSAKRWALRSELRR